MYFPFQMNSVYLYLPTAGILALGILWLRHLRSKSHKLPPGPYSIPIIGTISLGTNKSVDGKESKEKASQFQIFQEYSRKYGDVFSISMFGNRIIVLNSIDSIREAMLVQGDTNAVRSLFSMDKLMNPKLLGLLFSEGDLWREQRRFALHTLRDMGFGRESAEAAIQDELQALIKEIEGKDGASTSLDPQFLLSRSVANVICVLVFGERLAQEPEFRSMSSIINGDIISRISPSNSFFVFAFAGLLAKLPGDMFGIKCVLRSRDKVRDYVNRKVQEHEASYNESYIRDYIDAFIQQMRQRSNSSQKHYFTSEQLVESLWTLFIAGQETTATALRWGILLLAHHPEVQKRVHQEMDEKLGEEEHVITYADRALLAYTDSVFNEVLRFGSIVPLVGHRVTSPLTLSGFNIPVGMTIFGNIYAALHDAHVWPSPDTFDPDKNFPLGAVGTAERTQLVQNHVAFGLGKRSCLGEVLARQELFIFLCGLLQKFEFLPDPNCPLPQEHLGTDGITRGPLPYQVIFRPRK